MLHVLRGQFVAEFTTFMKTLGYLISKLICFLNNRNYLNQGCLFEFNYMLYGNMDSQVSSMTTVWMTGV
jgi:hypothetical protein